MAEGVKRRNLQLRRITAALIGAGVGYSLAQLLPLIPSTVLSALLLVGGTILADRLNGPLRWWGWIGTACGSLVGTASSLTTALRSAAAQQQPLEPRITVLLLALTGLIAGLQLSRTGRWRDNRHPRDLLRSASALTTGAFAAVVTITYLSAGLDAARTLSSRLSTALTILVFSLIAPGWLVHLFSQGDGPRDEHHRNS